MKKTINISTLLLILRMLRDIFIFRKIPCVYLMGVRIMGFFTGGAAGFRPWLCHPGACGMFIQRRPGFLARDET